MPAAVRTVILCLSYECNNKRHATLGGNCVGPLWHMKNTQTTLNTDVFSPVVFEALIHAHEHFESVSRPRATCTVVATALYRIA